MTYYLRAYRVVGLHYEKARFGWFVRSFTILLVYYSVTHERQLMI